MSKYYWEKNWNKFCSIFTSINEMPEKSQSLHLPVFMLIEKLVYISSI